jgi:alkane 1-monooxygenase
MVATEGVDDTDSRRYWWLIGALSPFAGLVAFGLYMLTGWIVWLVYVPVHVYVLVPVADHLVGTYNANLADRFAASRFYSRLMKLFVWLQLYTFLAALWFIVVEDASFFEQMMLAASVGIMGGIAISPAHELGHRTDRWSWLGRMSLAQTFYGHFNIEHNRGHHRQVATPPDPASARYGESFYAFWPRVVFGSIRGAWNLEADRMRREGRRVLNRRNKTLQAWAMSIGLWGYAILYAGFDIIPFLLVQAVIGFSMAEMVNYIGHYGLLRQKLPNGSYESVKPEHSWNSNFPVSNLFLFNLQRHPDHHCNPHRPYQVLRTVDESPNLPFGYAPMLMLGLIPPLWFRFMNPRVEAFYDGDLTRANLADGVTVPANA